MATEKQETTAKRNVKKAQSVSKAGSATKSGGLSTAKRNDLPESAFAFPEQRKEPLSDARHVRNAIARFDQVEDVSDAERDAAWKRIRAAAKKHGVEVNERSWRDLMKGGKAGT